MLLVGGVVVGSHVDAAVPDGLAVLLRFLGEAEHTADHERARHLRTGRLDVLDGEAETGEGVCDLLGSDPLGAGSPAHAATRSGLSSDTSVGEKGETDVALDEVAQVGGPGTEHDGAVDAHAEGETRVGLGVDPAGPQHARVDHPAAAPLDPSLGTAGPAGTIGVADGIAVADEALEIDLGRRLGEREVVGGASSW